MSQFQLTLLTALQNDLAFVFPIVLRCKTKYILAAVRLSGILKGKQKLGVTFNSEKLGGIDFSKFSKLTMCSA